MHGLTNWTEVADHVGSKTKTQCHSHYYEKYMARRTNNNRFPFQRMLRTGCAVEARLCQRREDCALRCLHLSAPSPASLRPPLQQSKTAPLPELTDVIGKEGFAAAQAAGYGTSYDPVRPLRLRSISLGLVRAGPRALRTRVLTHHAPMRPLATLSQATGTGTLGQIFVPANASEESKRVLAAAQTALIEEARSAPCLPLSFRCTPLPSTTPERSVL